MMVASFTCERTKRNTNVSGDVSETRGGGRATCGGTNSPYEMSRHKRCASLEDASPRLTQAFSYICSHLIFFCREPLRLCPVEYATRLYFLGSLSPSADLSV
jgi:hypothetical protein